MQTFLKSYIDDTDLSNRSCVNHAECVDKGRRHLAWQYSSICSLSRRGKGGVSNALRVKSGQRLAKKKISPSTPAGGGTLWQLLANKMQTTSSAVGCVAVSGLMKGFFHRHNTKTSSSNYGVTLPPRLSPRQGSPRCCRVYNRDGRSSKGMRRRWTIWRPSYCICVCLGPAPEGTHNASCIRAARANSCWSTEEAV